MIKTINIDTTLIAYRRISDASAEGRHSCRRTNDADFSEVSRTNDEQRRLNRRDREKAAIAQIIRHIAGDEAALSHTAEGAPLLPGYNISVTHSQQIAAVAFDKERKIGIDAEEWRPTLTRVASRFLSDDELSVFTTPAQLLKAWTAKEAIYKIIGSHAVDFRCAISLSHDLNSAHCCCQHLNLQYFTIDNTLITLAKEK